jgi:hypothetical protein
MVTMQEHVMMTCYRPKCVTSIRRLTTVTDWAHLLVTKWQIVLGALSVTLRACVRVIRKNKRWTLRVYRVR